MRYGGAMLRVDTVPSEAGGQEPGVIWFGARRVKVLAVIDRWYGRDQSWWKVQTDEGHYVLRQDEVSGTWELAAIVGR